MSLRVFRQSATATFGFWVSLASVIVAASLVVLMIMSVLMTRQIPAEPLPHLRALIWLTLFLIVAYVVWLTLLGRGRVSGATGAGFPLAAYAVAARAYGELVRSLPYPWVRAPVPDASSLAWLTFARQGTLVVFVFALAVVVFACLSERALARRAPEWAKPTN